MSSTSIDMPDNFADAKLFRELFIDPAIEAIREEMRSHLGPIAETQKAVTAKVDGFDARMSRVEKDQKKALLGWGVYATALAAGMTYAWKYISSKIHLG